MKLAFLVFLNKLITKVLHLLRKNGSQYPGYFIYDVLKQKDVLEHIKYPKYVVAVTGSSGKGSTTNLVNHILTDNGYKVCYNESGGNGVLAIVTKILNSCNFKGELKCDVLLLECDERHLKLIFGKNKMTHLIITNITRDQPSRNGNPIDVFNDILLAIDKNCKILINKDDPLLNRLTYSLDNEIKTYGVSKLDASFKNPTLDNLDFAYCPKCHTKLKYNYYHYGHIGNFYCPNCDFKRGKVDYEVTKVDYKNHYIVIDNEKIFLNKDVLYAVYYTLGSYSICRMLGLSKNDILHSLNDNKLEAKRGKEFLINGRKLTMLETKNENNLSYYQSIRYIKDQEGKKSIILGFQNVSRRYKFNDLSWLYDIDFELLNDENIDKIFILGRFKYDVKCRLMMANISEEKMVLVDDVNNLPELVKDSVGDIYTMVCFDMTEAILKVVRSVNDENN